MKISLTRQSAARLYFLLVLLGLPLYFTNGFNNILESKTYFVWLSIVIGSVMAIALLIKWIIDRIKDKQIGGAFKSAAGSFISSINIMDICIAAFGIICVISSALSEYPNEAFSGSMAWHVGGAMLFMLCIMYFVYSRFGGEDFVPFAGMMLGGTLTMILAILNDLWIDPLHIMTADDNWKDHFTSTIGNIDQFSGYLSIIIPVLVMMFVISSNGFKRTAAAIVLFLAYLNMFLTHADSIYIGVGIGYLFIIAFCLRNTNRYLGLLINGILFGVAGFAARVIILYRPEIRLDDISPILLAHNLHLVVGGACFVLLLLHLFLELHFSKEQLQKILEKVFWIYVVLAVVFVVAVIVFSVTHFDMYFLNRRGLLWYISVYSFTDADLPQQLVGIGPGCVDTISENFYFEIEEAFEDFYFLENLHNDVLEYLVTTGALGALSYLGVYICVIVDFVRMIFKNEDDNSYKCYALIGLIGYIAQSIINGPHPLNTAMFFAFLALYRGACLIKGPKTS